MDLPITLSGIQTVTQNSVRVDFGLQPGQMRMRQLPDGSMDFIIASGIAPTIHVQQNVGIYCFGDESIQQVMPSLIRMSQLGAIDAIQTGTITVYCKGDLFSLDPGFHISETFDSRFAEYLDLVQNKESYDTNEALETVGGYTRSALRTHANKFNKWISQNTYIEYDVFKGVRGRGYLLNKIIRIVRV